MMNEIPIYGRLNFVQPGQSFQTLTGFAGIELEICREKVTGQCSRSLVIHAGFPFPVTMKIHSGV